MNKVGALSRMANSWPPPRAAGFEIFITADKNLRYQQNLGSRRLAIIELPTNRLSVLPFLLPALLPAIASATPGSYQTVSAP